MNNLKKLTWKDQQRLIDNSANDDAELFLAKIFGPTIVLCKDIRFHTSQLDGIKDELTDYQREVLDILPERDYNFGDKFIIEDEKYVLADLGNGEIALICINDGIIWSDPMTFHSRHIPEKVIRKLIDDTDSNTYKWEFISE